MAAPTHSEPAFTSKYNQGNYNSTWASVYNIIDYDQILPELYNKYGRKFEMNEFLQFASKVINIPFQQLSLLEEDAKRRSVKIGAGGITTGAAGADITFKIDSTMYAGTQGVLVEGQSIMLPAASQASGEVRSYRIKTITPNVTPADGTYLATPFNKDGTTQTASQVTTEVAAGTELPYGGVTKAAGTRQPDGFTNGYFQRDFATFLLKASRAIEGGQIKAKDAWQAVKTTYGNGQFGKASIELDFELDDALNKMLFNGEKNDNTTMVETSVFGGSNAVLSEKGLWNYATEDGMQFNWSDTIQPQDFSLFRRMYDTQGVSTKNVNMFMGQEVCSVLEDSGLEFSQQFSDTNFRQKLEKIDMTYRETVREGKTYRFIPLETFTDPTSYGAPGLDGYFANALIGVPDVPKVNMKTAPNMNLGEGGLPAMSNVTLANVNYGGENRGRIITNRAGMNGLGFDVTDDADGIWMYGLLHQMLVVTNANQLIRGTKS